MMIIVSYYNDFAFIQATEESFKEWRKINKLVNSYSKEEFISWCKRNSDQQIEEIWGQLGFHKKDLDREKITNFLYEGNLTPEKI